MKTKKQLFHSLDRSLELTSDYSLPDRYRDLTSLDPSRKYIAQGAGLSYVPASFGEGVQTIGMQSFNRILSFSPEKQVVEVEAGISLSKLYTFLAAHGFYVSVQPGSPQITVGGCIAFNIFGKNQFREGLFSSVVEEIEIYHPSKGLLRLSETSNPDLLSLTCGGMGLTGLILKAKLRLKKIPSPLVNSRNIPVRSLHETFEQLQSLKDSADMLYSWNDLSSTKSLGHGFIIVGRFVENDAVTIANIPDYKGLRPEKKGVPFGFFNAFTSKLFNRLFEFYNLRIKPEAQLPLYQYIFPIINKTLYFDLYGKSGFRERQILIPTSAVSDYLKEFESLVRTHRPVVPLCSCKIFSGEQRYLQFNGNGMVLSIDTPAGQDETFQQALTTMNVHYQAIDNIAKDSHLSQVDVQSEYRQYQLFREKLIAFDPQRIFKSALSEKLGL